MARAAERGWLDIVASDVHNPFKPGSVIYQLMDGDFSNMTVDDIAKKFGKKRNTIRYSLYRIRDVTGYEVPHKGAYYKAKNDTYVDIYQTAKPITERKRIQHKCSTCGNGKCRKRFLILEFRHCGNWIPEGMKHGG